MIGQKERSLARQKLREAGLSKTVAPRYGFRCTLERIQKGEKVREKFYYKGAAPSQARARAEFKSGFIRVVELAPLTRAEWDKEHEGKAAAK
jgi:hypothetical protein